MLHALPAATIEQLAARLEHAEFAPGQTVFEQAEHGEQFYVVEAGEAEVVRDGHLVRADETEVAREQRRQAERFRT